MMAEVKAMMDDPAWSKKMKEMAKSKEFKDSVKTTKEYMADPTKAAMAEAKVEHMAKVGGEQLKSGANNALDEALDSLKDPAIMAEMTKMMKDPNFKQKMKAMMNDNQFKEYASAMKDMMKDPNKKAFVEGVAANLKATL
jgi:tyrosyl-tRNA synthetase